MSLNSHQHVLFTNRKNSLCFYVAWISNKLLIIFLSDLSYDNNRLLCIFPLIAAVSEVFENINRYFAYNKLYNYELSIRINLRKIDSKTLFESISHDIFIDKLKFYDFQKQSISWFKSFQKIESSIVKLIKFVINQEYSVWDGSKVKSRPNPISNFSYKSMCPKYLC